MKLKSKTTATLLIAILMISAFAVVIPLSLGLSNGFTLETKGSATSVLSEWISHSATHSVHLETTGTPVGDEARIVINMPDTFTLGDLETISWYTYLIAGSTAHIDVILDLNDDGDYGALDDALVIQYAYNDYKHYLDHINPNPLDPAYGALTGAWYQTFGDDGDGPTVIDGDAMAWATKGAAGPLSPADPMAVTDNFHFYSLTEWQSPTGVTYEASGQAVKTINAASRVLRLEIEVDNWGDNSEAYIDDVLINNLLYNFESSGPIDLLATVETLEMSFTVTGSADFGSMKPGTITDPALVLTIANTGDYKIDITAELTEDTDSFYANYLTIGADFVDDWELLACDTTFSGPVLLKLDIPITCPPKSYTGKLVFWAEAIEYTP